MRWNFHGHPDDVSRQSTICLYCEVVWHKQFYHMTLLEMCQHNKTEKGEMEIEYYKNEVVKLKKRGPNKRIADAIWQKIPIPTLVTKEKIAEVEVAEPPEEFYERQDYFDMFGRWPEEAGLLCEWEVVKGKRKWGGVGGDRRSHEAEEVAKRCGSQNRGDRLERSGAE